MKKCFMMVLTLALCVSCAAKKPVAQPAAPQKSATELEIERLKQEKELRALKAEMEQDSIDRARAREISDLKHSQKLSALNMKETLEEGMKMLLIPCMEESLGYEATVDMAALGIANDKPSIAEAELSANRMAISDITSRFVGIIKNGVEQYEKDSRAKSGNRGQESQLEGLAVSVGEKTIEKLIKPGCRKVMKNAKGNYDFYQAMYVPMEPVMDAVIDAVEEAEIDVDKAIFRSRMQAELDRQSAKLEAEAAQKRAAIESAKGELE